MPTPTPIKGRKLRMYWQMHRTKIIIVSVVVLLIVLAVLGLRSLESFYRNMTLATLPLNIILAAISASVFVFMYIYGFGRGLSSVGKNPIKSQKVNVHWDDVIGMEELREEGEEDEDHSKIGRST